MHTQSFSRNHTIYASPQQRLQRYIPPAGEEQVDGMVPPLMNGMKNMRSVDSDEHPPVALDARPYSVRHVVRYHHHSKRRTAYGTLSWKVSKTAMGKPEGVNEAPLNSQQLVLSRVGNVCSGITSIEHGDFFGSCHNVDLPLTFLPNYPTNRNRNQYLITGSSKNTPHRAKLTF